MRLPKSIAVLSLMVFLASSAGFGQNRFQAEIHFTPAFPQDGFKDNVDTTGWGGSLFFAFNIPRSVLSVGASFDYVVYGSESRVEPFSPTIPEVFVKVTTTNAILNGHLFLRVQPRSGRVRPYIDGLIGFHHLRTDTGVKDEDAFDDTIASSNQMRDTAFSYGVGGGLMIPLFRRNQARNAGRFAIDLDLGIRYLKGGRAQYLTEGAIHLDSRGVWFDVSESNTDIFSARLGVVFSF